MEQELAFIEMLNRAIASGKLTDSKYHRIHVERIPMDRELGYRSKMDRSPALLDELREFGGPPASHSDRTTRSPS